MEVKLCNMRSNNIFLDMVPKVPVMYVKINVILHKIKSFLHIKWHSQQWKGNQKNGEKIYANSMCNKDYYLDYIKNS